MWVQGQVVNSPSDAAGPRKVSDALLVRREAAPALRLSFPSFRVQRC